MDIEDLNLKGYLEELYRQTGGDTEVQISMYELGEAIGYNKAEAGSLAEQLMVQGQVELRTLSGGISITSEGLAMLGIAVPSPRAADSGRKLSHGPVADDTDRQLVHLLVDNVKSEISGLGLEYHVLEELVLDLKTIEVHMLSPKPKTAVLREIFRSLQNVLDTAKAENIVVQLRNVIG